MLITHWSKAGGKAVHSACTCRFLHSHIDGIKPKWPYPPCLRTADRALLAGYARHRRWQLHSSMKAHCLTPEDFTRICVCCLATNWCLFACALQHFCYPMRSNKVCIKKRASDFRTMWCYRNKNLAIKYCCVSTVYDPLRRSGAYMH